MRRVGPDQVGELVRSLSEHSHRRRNALTGEWVLVSPHRTRRPWLGQEERAATQARKAYDPQCYLCPGNARAEGVRNPDYAGTFVFANDFTALTSRVDVIADDPLFTAETVGGECRVVCYSPRHDLSFGQLTEEQALAVVDTWRAQIDELEGRSDIACVLAFENRGEMMGASNPHPHGQIWATSVLPDEVERELAAQAAFARTTGRVLLQDYLEAELTIGSRIVTSSAHWTALVPFWAEWPFELLLLPRRPVAAFNALSRVEAADLARALQEIVALYDRVFDVPFPYSMGWHSRPKGAAESSWVLHAHFLPPLLRSSTVRKFQVGFELLGMPQRDMTPEAAADVLRKLARR